MKQYHYCSDEWYPIYSVHYSEKTACSEGVIELTEEEYAKIKDADDAFLDAQAFLTRRIEGEK